MATGEGSRVKQLPRRYTLILAAVSDTINASLYEKLNVNFIRDIDADTNSRRPPQVRVVGNPSVPD